MKIRKPLFLACVLLIAMVGVSLASQNTIVIPNTGTLSGLTLVNTTNSAMNTLVTNNSGSSAPSTAYSYQTWADTSNNLLKFTPDGTNWYPMGSFASSQWISASAGILSKAIASTGSSNAYVVTYSPAATALVTGAHYPFIANFANTGSATENVNSIGAKTIKKLGGTNLASGDIGNGAVVDTVYDGTNMQMVSQIGNGSTGTVTSVDGSGGTTGLAVTGGPITGTGTLTLGGTLIVPNGGTGDSTLTAHGLLVGEGTSAVAALAAGTANQPVVSGGASADPAYLPYTVPATIAAHQTLVATGSTAVVAKTVPDCPDSGGNHLNYTQSTDVYSCGASGTGFTSCTVVQSTTGTSQTATCASGYYLTGGTCSPGTQNSGATITGGLLGSIVCGFTSSGFAVAYCCH